ncbi:MAG TPA: transposase, partial [Acidimicrobiales bacterium]|nr:transposase [Acidimicrobiales bacterium]
MADPFVEVRKHAGPIAQLAADLLADLIGLDKKLAAVEAEIRSPVKRTPTGLPDIYGIGPVITASILGQVGDVARFRDRHQFASDNGTAPDDRGSAGRPVHCVNLMGNRRLNHAIHMAAITQIRNRRSPGRAYYDRKLAEAKTKKEALRCLKRWISDTIYRQLVDDAARWAETGPGGQTGTTLQSSVTGPTPTAGSSDKPQPGPTTETTPTPLANTG